MNETLNGSKFHKNYLKWFQSEFPLLNTIWQSTDIKATGSEIAKRYETRIIFNPELYRLTETLDIKIIPEHDGLGVFAASDDNKLTEKLEKISKHLSNYSSQQFAVPIVVKTKLVDDWTTTNQHEFMRHRARRLARDYTKLRANVRRAMRTPHAFKTETKHGEKLMQLKAKGYDLLERNIDVLYYLSDTGGANN